MSKNCAVLVAAFSGCLLFVGQAVTADAERGKERLPEPTHEFAKEVTNMVKDQELAFKKAVEELEKGRARFAPKRNPQRSLAEDAAVLLESAQQLLATHKQLVSDLTRFRANFTEAAGHYRKVAAPYTAHAQDARSADVKEDYLLLARAYELKANKTDERARGDWLPGEAESLAEVIKEGNRFLESFVEGVTAVPVGEDDGPRFAERLQQHAGRCQALSAAFTGAVQKALGKAEVPETRQPGPRTAAPGTSSTPTERPAENAQLALTKEDSLLGSTWTGPLVVGGVHYVQVLRLFANGVYWHSIYLTGARGVGPLVAMDSGSFTFFAGELAFYRPSGALTERGRVTFLGQDQLVYEILENVHAPGIAGCRVTLARLALDVRPTSEPPADESRGNDGTAKPPASAEKGKGRNDGRK